VYTFANPIRRAHQDIECVGLDQGLKNSGERVRVRARWRNPAEQLPHEFVWELFELLPDLQLHPLPRSAPTWLQEPRRSLPPLLGPPPATASTITASGRGSRGRGDPYAPPASTAPPAVETGRRSGRTNQGCGWESLVPKARGTHGKK
jgi:hypothetical protein